MSSCSSGQVAKSNEWPIKFDEPRENLYDIVIVVEGKEFFCSKMMLARQSQSFYSMFFEDPATKEEARIDISKECEAWVFKAFLDVIHGLKALNDLNVAVVLRFAKHFKAQVAIHQCVEYLRKDSSMFPSDKYKLFDSLGFDHFKIEVLGTITEAHELHKIIPDNIMDLDHATMGLFFQRNLEIQNLRHKRPFWENVQMNSKVKRELEMEEDE